MSSKQLKITKMLHVTNLAVEDQATLSDHTVISKSDQRPCHFLHFNLKSEITGNF